MIEVYGKITTAEAVLLQEYAEGANYTDLARKYGTDLANIKVIIKKALYNLLKNTEV